MTEATIEKLRALRLDAFAEALVAQHKQPDVLKLPFDERLAMLVDAEWLHRENKRLQRALKEAKLKIGGACIENIDYHAKRELERQVIRQLATCRWVAEHQNVVITGATGTGKTYLACALAQQACRKGHRAVYRRASRLTDELTLARADGSYGRLLTRLARVDVLILDDWGHAPLRDQERRDLLEVLDDRCTTRSTIMTSQLDPKLWHDHIGDPTCADAICDRILHSAHKLRLKGPSRRNPKETLED